MVRGDVGESFCKPVTFCGEFVYEHMEQSQTFIFTFILFIKLMNLNGRISPKHVYTLSGVAGIGLLVGDEAGLFVGVTVMDGACDAFTEIGTFPSDIDIASGKNDFCDVEIVDTGLLGNPAVFLAYDVELDGELVLVIVKLGVIFMLDCALDRLAAKMSA